MGEPGGSPPGQSGGRGFGGTGRFLRRQSLRPPEPRERIVRPTPAEEAEAEVESDARLIVTGLQERQSRLVLVDPALELAAADERDAHGIEQARERLRQLELHGLVGFVCHVK